MIKSSENLKTLLTGIHVFQYVVGSSVRHKVRLYWPKEFIRAHVKQQVIAANFMR